MAIDQAKFCAQIVYFEVEGRHNLDEVLRVIKRTIKKRSELKSHKIVIFTAQGQGPALAYNRLAEFDPKIIAVTFPHHFSIKGQDGERFYPKISENIRRFFAGVQIDVVVPPTLPFDLIDGMEGHNQQVKLISQTLAMFGGGFALCVQAVLRACDVGLLEEGESVIAMSGDVAGLFTASTTSHFLNVKGGLSVQEIFCKPRNLTQSRPKPEEKKLIEGEVSKPLLQS